MKFILLFVLTMMFSTSKAQINSNNSKSIDFSGSFVERVKHKSQANFLDTKKVKSIYLSQVLNSGKIVYSSPTINYLQSLVDRLIEDESGLRILLVNSNEAGTFSDEKGKMFITTGLIAQTTNQNQLLFFIAREIEKSIGMLSEELAKNARISVSYDEKIASLILEDIGISLKVDQLAIERIESKLGFIVDFNKCLSIIELSDLPYSLKKVPSDYLNTETFHVPTNYFEVMSSKEVVAEDQAKTNRVNRRKKSLNTKYPVDNVLAVAGGGSPSEYSALLKETRFEYLNQCIIGSKYEIALYTIFLLEDEFGSSPDLQFSKSLSWFGFALREMDVLPRPPINYYRGLQNSGIDFFSTLRRLPKQARIAKALREIYDEKKTNPDLDIIWRQLLGEVKEFPYFDLKTFSTENYFEVFVENESVTAQDKYVYVDSLNANTDRPQLTDSTKKFYLYGLCDIISEGSIFNEMETSQASQLEVGKTIGVYPSILCNKSFEQNLKKSSKKLVQFSTEIDKLEGVSIAGNLSELEYNLQCEIRELLSQHFQSSKYNYPMPLMSENLKSFLREQPFDYISLPFYQNGVRPKIRGFHFIGLFVVPLPFVIPDILLKLYQTSFCNIILSTDTSEVVFSEYVNYYEPLNKRNMIDRFQQSIFQSQTKNQ